MLLVIAALGCSGCYSVSIATSTGDRREGAWSTAPRQEAHVGETVEFSVMLTNPLTGRPAHGRETADYCVLFVGGRRVEWDLDPDGRFHGQLTFDTVEAGQTVRVAVEVYLQRAARDFLQLRDEWLRNQSPHDWPDHLIASKDLAITIYQSKLRMSVPMPAGGYDPSTAKLLLRRLDGKETTIFVEHPPRRGFILTERPDGLLEVGYEPLAAEVSPYGATAAEFSVYDARGVVQTAEQVLLTP